jgi:glycosyltransferase involved in cell wall biosynthesis
MAKRRTRHDRKTRPDPRRSSTIKLDTRQVYGNACRLVKNGEYQKARQLYDRLNAQVTDTQLESLVCNDLAALVALEGDVDRAQAGFQEALAIDGSCEPAKLNLALLESPEWATNRSSGASPAASLPSGPTGRNRRCKVAILSFLFNWPSTGGGIIHTVELAQFLTQAGYEVQHLYACYAPWEIGGVNQPLPFPSKGLQFEESTWNAAHIQERFREAVAEFDPDHVIITDSWNFKPLLADAVRDYPYILRFQALECLCPLNNVRLLPEPNGRFRQCGRHQLAAPGHCRRCLQERSHMSGGLHQAERKLSAVGTKEYDRVLRRAFEEAEAVFVVNPLAEAMVSPYADSVRVSPAGMDPARFPWPWPEEPRQLRSSDRTTLFFAGLVQEGIKGYHVLQEACVRLWQRRQDFELVATGDPPGSVDAFTRFVGWQSQEELPRYLRAADICVVPTIAQEALGRTAVEAMAVGRPVIASRLGGLPFTITDGMTGLLFEAGNAGDLAQKIEILLNHHTLREQMGTAGRERFERYFRWDVIIDRDYRPLLVPAQTQPTKG